MLIQGCQHFDRMPEEWAAQGQAQDSSKASRSVVQGRQSSLIP